MAKEEKHGCKPGFGILGAIFMAFGIYFLIWGIMLQVRGNISLSMWNWSAIILYLVALLLLGFGKMLKCMGHHHDGKAHFMK